MPTVQAFGAELYASIFAEPVVKGKARWLACLNPHSYAVAKDDAHFAKALKNADWLIPDGAGVVLASKMMGGRVTERITGSDVFSSLLERMNSEHGHSVFFLGSTEETLMHITTKMARDYPQIRLAGTYSPPFKATYSVYELHAIIDAINVAKPDVLWVGMTAPRQEKLSLIHI